MDLPPILLISLIMLGLVSTTKSGSSCGYQSCDVGKADMLNVHLVPHSHCDTGWDKTVDEYFYGSRNNIQDVGLQYSLESIVQALHFDKQRRFTWIEVAYFWRWWEEKDDFTKNVVRELVAEGRLMFGNNGWSMSDEGSPYYQELVDQHTLGQEFLVKVFGEECVRPFTAWQIDTFGHSKEMANLMAQMGHDSFYFGRLDYQEKEARWANRSMEMLWAGRPSDQDDQLDAASTIFTGVLPNLYLAPNGFDFIWDEPIMDDPRLFGNNLENRIEKFVALMREWSKAYATNHLLITMGHDFEYERSNRWFINMDKLIRHINSRSSQLKMNLLYSTVPCYTYAVHSTGFRFPVKSDDFFPYADIPHRFWTGTFTSRPTMKGFVRDANALLQTCKQLSVLRLSKSGHVDVVQQKRVDFLRRAMAIVTNHGQFPGTETQAVTFDNALRVHNGTLECERLIQDAFKTWEGPQVPVAQLCTTLNISSCHATENALDSRHAIEVIFYNSLPQSVVHWARIPFASNNVNVSFLNGTSIPTQSIAISNRTKSIPERSSTASFEIIHRVILPPMGFQRIQYSVDSFEEREIQPTESKFQQQLSISNGRLRLEFHPQSRMLHRVIDLETGRALLVSLDMRYYTGFVGECGSSPERTPAGAYIFRPNEKEPIQFPEPKMTMVDGPLVQEVTLEFSTWATLVVRLYYEETAPMFEVQWTAGPIPMVGIQGKELILYYTTSLNTSSATFYTDSNGRQMMKRRLNYRPSWKFENTEPVAGNYYPVSNLFYLEDDVTDDQFTILVDRSQSMSSLHSGSVEALLHRRLGVDDCLGVDEALNETGKDDQGLIARGKHWVMVADKASSKRLMRRKNMELQMRPTISARPYQSTSKNLPESYSALIAPLPPNIHLLTLEAFRDGQSFLLRLEHIYDTKEDKEYSKPQTINLQTIFRDRQLVEAEEYSLSGAMPKKNMTRLQWNAADNVTVVEDTDQLDETDFQVTLKPMEIRTWRIRLLEK